MSKCCKCGKELPENTQGTVCQECFWCSYTSKVNEKMSIKRYGKTYKNAEEIYNFIKDKKDVVLVSIDELEQKDQQIAELEIENETLSNALLEKPDNLELLQLREDLKILSKQNAHKEHMENLRLKTELADIKENAIVPKFKLKQKVWYINSNKDVISGVIYNIRYDSNYGFSYFIPNLQLETFRIEEINLYATPEQAKETLKKLEGETK